MSGFIRQNKQKSRPIIAYSAKKNQSMFNNIDEYQKWFGNRGVSLIDNKKQRIDENSSSKSNTIIDPMNLTFNKDGYTQIPKECPYKNWNAYGKNNRIITS